jgi:hypothetical protein
MRTNLDRRIGRLRNASVGVGNGSGGRLREVRRMDVGLVGIQMRERLRSRHDAKGRGRDARGRSERGGDKARRMMTVVRLTAAVWASRNGARVNDTNAKEGHNTIKVAKVCFRSFSSPCS